MSNSFEPDERRQASVKASLMSVSDRREEQVGEAMSAATKEKKQVAGGILQPFRVRNFKLLFGGQTVSVIGDALYAVALPWLILTTGGSAQELGIVLAAYGIPRAGSMLVGGWLSDRLRPRRLMLIADAVRALLMALLAALALWGHPSVFQLCAIAIPLGAFGGAFIAASMAIAPDILSNDDLQAANALNFASMQGANLVGSAVAGVVVAAFTAGAGLAIDAATFIISVVSLALMRMARGATPGTKVAEESQEHPSTATSERGAQVSFWRFLRISRLIQITLLVSILVGFCSGGLIEVALLHCNPTGHSAPSDGACHGPADV